MDVQQIKFFSLLQILSLVLLTGDLQFVKHFWMLGRAFNSLDHNILLDRLHTFGVSGTELLWFCHYFADQQQRLLIF